VDVAVGAGISLIVCVNCATDTAAAESMGAVSAAALTAVGAVSAAAVAPPTDAEAVESGDSDTVLSDAGSIDTELTPESEESGDESEDESEPDTEDVDSDATAVVDAEPMIALACAGVTVDVTVALPLPPDDVRTS